jgi:hypothetical protein
MKSDQLLAEFKAYWRIADELLRLRVGIAHGFSSASPRRRVCLVALRRSDNACTSRTTGRTGG